MKSNEVIGYYCKLKILPAKGPWRKNFPLLKTHSSWQEKQRFVCQPTIRRCSFRIHARNNSLCIHETLQNHLLYGKTLGNILGPIIILCQNSLVNKMLIEKWSNLNVNGGHYRVSFFYRLKIYLETKSDLNWPYSQINLVKVTF